MIALWQFIRKHPVGTTACAVACIAPLDAAFVATMRTNPVIANLCLLAMGSMAIPIGLSMLAMVIVNPIWPLPKSGDLRCPTCGYDLRATPDRCPECGTEPKDGTG